MTTVDEQPPDQQQAEGKEDEEEELWERENRRFLEYQVRGEWPKTLFAIQDKAICSGRREFPSHGHCVWDAALFLADYLQAKVAANALCVENKLVVELGAGVGLVGMTLAALGAQVVLTDQEYNLPLLRDNIAKNFADSSCPPVVEELQWGADNPLGEFLQAHKDEVALMVFSDVLYNEQAIPLLVQSISRLTGKETQVVFAFETRNRQLEALFLRLMEANGFCLRLMSQPDQDIFQRLHYEHLDELFVYWAVPEHG